MSQSAPEPDPAGAPRLDPEGASDQSGGMVGVRSRIGPVRERVDVPALVAAGVADEQEAEPSDPQVAADCGASTVVYTVWGDAPLL